MSPLINHELLAALTGTASVVCTLGLIAWRFALECERGWLRSGMFPPEPFEEDLFARMRAELRSSAQRAPLERRSPGLIKAGLTEGQLALAQ